MKKHEEKEAKKIKIQAQAHLPVFQAVLERPGVNSPIGPLQHSPAVGLPGEPASLVRRLFQPSVLIESVRGRPGDGRLQLLPRARAD